MANHLLPCKYFVTPVGTLQEQVILGRPWIVSTSCQVNWVEDTTTMYLPHGTTTVHLCKENTKDKQSTASVEVAVSLRLTPTSFSKVVILTNNKEVSPPSQQTTQRWIRKDLLPQKG